SPESTGLRSSARHCLLRLQRYSRLFWVCSVDCPVCAQTGQSTLHCPRRSMPKEHINPKSLFPSVQHGFSQIVTARGGKTVYISGQTAWDAKKQIIGGKNLGEQTRQALRNIRTAVEAAGGTLTDIVSVRVYVV